jgi:hypothetical protein
MIDAMILVAGTATGLAGWRAVLAMAIMQDTSFRGSLQWFYFHALGLTTLLVPLSLGLLMMALRQPHPRLSRMLDRPALVVGLTVLIVFATNTAIRLALMGFVGFSISSFFGGKIFYYFRLLAEQTGMCLLVAWVPRAIAGRCRGPVSCGWLDRLGWALWSCWVLLAIGSSIFTLI